MKIDWVRAKSTSSAASSAGFIVVAAAAATFAVSLASTDMARAQGLLGIYEEPAKKSKAEKAPKPIVVAAGQNPSQISTQSLRTQVDDLKTCSDIESKALVLRAPGGKNVVQFDKCYRGRVHNVCVAKALSAMVATLQRDYEKLIETNYPAIASTSAVCAFKLGQLTEDFETGKAFHARYKTLVDGYGERLKCTDLILKSLEKATFPDLPNLDKTVKTMGDDLKADVAQFAKERQLADELLTKVSDAQKALEVQIDVHRAMCMTTDTVSQR